MSASIVRAEYYHATVEDRPGEGYHLLSRLAQSSVDLLAFNAVPIGGGTTQLTLFPRDPQALLRAAEEHGIVLTGPQHAFVVRGDDQLGALAEVHRRLFETDVNVFASAGVTADCGRFAYVVHVREEEFERAAEVLEAR